MNGCVHKMMLASELCSCSDIGQFSMHERECRLTVVIVDDDDDDNLLYRFAAVCSDGHVVA
jgi:hypothetical protein